MTVLLIFGNNWIHVLKQGNMRVDNVVMLIRYSNTFNTSKTAYITFSNELDMQKGDAIKKMYDPRCNDIGYCYCYVI